MYFAEPYTINLENAIGEITILQPTIGDIVRLGEDKFYSTLSILVGNTTQFRLLLWQSGLDWNEVSDFHLFCLMYKQMDPDALKLLFGNLDVLSFEQYINTQDENQEIVLLNPDKTIEINEDVYQQFHQYYQVVFNMKPEELITKDKMLKKWWIEEDSRKAERDENSKSNGKDLSSSIQPLISAYVNHPGTKHSLQDLKNVGVAEFFDSIQRLQIYESATACIKGMYSGFVDGSKIKPEEYNWLKEFDE